MKTITVIIEYATVSPSVLENITFANLMGWCRWTDINEDYFEFSVYCREEDAAWVEKKLVQYV